MPTLRASRRTMAESVWVWQVKHARVVRKLAEVRSMSRTARVAASRTPSFGAVETAAPPDVGDGGRFSSADAVRTATVKQQTARTKEVSALGAVSYMLGFLRLVRPFACTENSPTGTPA